MGLTDTVIRNSKPHTKTNDSNNKGYKIADEKGMYLFVTESGSKYFRLDYRFVGKKKTLALGVYPETTLKEAREKRDEARKLIQQGIDPIESKKAKKLELMSESKNVFQAVAQEWYEKLKSNWSESHAQRKWHFLERDVFPVFGNTPIQNISAKELLTLFEKIQARGAIDIAHRVKGLCGEVFRYGINTGKCSIDPTQSIIGVLIPKRNKNMATITDPVKVGALLRAIDGYEGSIETKCALKLTPYAMLRPVELRSAEWAEIDIDKKLWKIPAEKMKMDRPHIIPLSNQVISILKEIQPVTGHWKYVFPSVRSKDRPMSNNTINAALRRMGYEKDEITAHGFRAMASTLLHENGFDSAHIEMQLAHAERNTVKAAYNHAEYLDKRTAMMQWWADYLDGLKDGKDSNNDNN